MAHESAREIKKGIVVLLDILGVSTLSGKEALELAKQKDELSNHWQDPDINALHELIKEPINTLQFGDSILITCECGYDTGVLAAFAQPLKQLMLAAFSKKMMLRGAIAVGEYVEGIGSNNVTILGPAVADAAAWYETADWAGIIATPRTGRLLNWFYQKVSNDQAAREALESVFVKTSIPLKSNSKEMWAVNWPAQLGNIPEATDEELYEDFLRHFALFDRMPPGTEDKYINTLRFLNERMA